jgi:hypothetical protein
VHACVAQEQKNRKDALKAIALNNLALHKGSSSDKTPTTGMTSSALLSERGGDISKRVTDLVQKFQERESTAATQKGSTSRKVLVQNIDSLESSSSTSATKHIQVGGSKSDEMDVSGKDKPSSVMKDRPHLTVIPSALDLSPRSSADVTITFRWSEAINMRGFLRIEPVQDGIKPLDVDFSAEVCDAEIQVDDYGTLNFGRQPIGEQAIITRTYSNESLLRVKWHVTNTNKSLIVHPNSGTLLPNELVKVKYIFRPNNQDIEVMCPFFILLLSIPQLEWDLFLAQG